MVQIAPLPLNSKKITVEMTLEEYMAICDQKNERNVGRGLNDLMDMFKCSKATAFKISHSDWFRPAIILRRGKVLSFDKDIALKLAQENIANKV